MKKKKFGFFFHTCIDLRDTYLYFIGPGLFQEYLNEPEMTKQRLLQIDGVRYVRTGDLQKWDANGNLVQVGRIDYQIKLRGQRIEPAEIEAVIGRASADIHESLVMKIDQDEQDYLVAYLATTIPESEQKRLSIAVETNCLLQLPPIKRPTLYMFWHGKNLPRSSNGKINRAMLPQPSFSIPKPHLIGSHHNKLSTIVIDEIRELWQQLLPFSDKSKKDDLSPDANWYRLGGDSLGIMKLMTLYRRHFLSSECELPMTELLSSPTIDHHLKSLNDIIEEEQQCVKDERTTQCVILQKTQATKGKTFVQNMEYKCDSTNVAYYFF